MSAGSDFSRDLADRRAVGWEIHKACRETDFFYVSHHRIAETLMAAQLDWTARFFALPMDKKRAIDFSRSPRRLGYEPALRQVLDEGSAPVIENLWPAGLAGFREQMLAYHAAIGGLALHLMRCIALSLDLGDMLRRWTNDLYQSTLHRVVNTKSGKDRYSVATFFSPWPDTEVSASRAAPKAGPCFIRRSPRASTRPKRRAVPMAAPAPNKAAATGAPGASKNQRCCRWNQGGWEEGRLGLE